MPAVALAMMLVLSVTICHGKTSVTYLFPTDSCVSDPYLVDENTIAYMKFEGDFGSPECRKMSFTTPKSAFYSYTMCMKELIYSSQNCHSTIYFKRCCSEYINYDYNAQISGDGCSGNSYMLYGNNRMFSQCLDDASHVSFELQKSQSVKNGYNRYDDRKPQEVIPDKLNDTFEFQIETKWDYNYGLIGGITGGIVGMCVLTGVGIFCRRRKRKTGKYCGTCPTYRPKYSRFVTEGLAQGFSAECAVAGILLCSCVLCRRQKCNGQEEDKCEKVSMETDCTSSDSENKWETVLGLKDPDTAPLLQCDS
ncbi:uncharacterized protein LOC127718263 [Mytilus californianus]|uniref:uncharacterized protein LOC127718263 n=1 Tax=Mytilus californianus TaxID=6549 RepID=UPI00224524B9|nr:uncharacterized protein LOC127718263 [Mytilus californianus]XP_052080228.1 uncharacterized protein LOC127718263 [Mytilus californianus]